MKEEITVNSTLKLVWKYIAPLVFLFSMYYYTIFIGVPFVIFGVDPDGLTVTLYTLYMIAYMSIYLAIIIYIYREDLSESFKDLRKNFLDYLDLGIPAWLLGLLAMIVLNVFIGAFTPNDLAGNEEAVRELVSLAPIYMVFSAVIFAPIIEELIFRKSLSNITSNKWLYIILSGLLFGAAHIVGSYRNVYDLFYILPYGVLGSIFAYVYYKTKNISLTIMLHMFHNSYGLLAQLIYYFVDLNS